MFEKLKWHRRITENERERLNEEYYELRRQLIKLTREQRAVWLREWDRLGAEGKPRPSTRYRHFAIRMNELAKTIQGDRLVLNVTGWSEDTIRINATAKDVDEKISMPYYDRI